MVLEGLFLTYWNPIISLTTKPTNTTWRSTGVCKTGSFLHVLNFFRVCNIGLVVVILCLDEKWATRDKEDSLHA